MSVSVAASATTPGTCPSLVAARSMASMWETVPAAALVGAWARAIAGGPKPTAPMAATFAVAVTISRRLGRWIMLIYTLRSDIRLKWRHNAAPRRGLFLSPLWGGG